MPQEFEVTDEDIAYSESILLPKGKMFDDERRTFIRNFETIDLQAVPGSGKTTALLAKLLILERKLPLNDGSGILVISHTNAAIDEIKEKIQKYCPKLFSYPNFVGTIQSFVDEFLAVPYYLSEYRVKPIRIDNEIYDEHVENFYKTTPNVTLKNWLSGKHDPVSFLKEIRLDVNGNLILKLDGTEASFELKSKTTSTYTSLLNFKVGLLKKGILHFDDAYTLANLQLNKIPGSVGMLQRRFRFVFVDEMQDMDKHQYDLLERIFFDEGRSSSKYQRIGDKNQSIFNGNAKTETYWEDRDIVMPLSGSQRLTPPVAKVVNKFALHCPSGFEIVGLSNGGIKPHIIIYSPGAIDKVIPAFLNIITTLQADSCFPLNPKYPIKVICWNTIWRDGERTNKNGVRLSDFHPVFSRDEHGLKIDHTCLKSYLVYFDRNKNTLAVIRKSILNALLKILRMENVLDKKGRNFTKKHLIENIADISMSKKNNSYEVFRLNLYKWSMEVIRGNVDQVHEAIANYVPEFLAIFEKEPANCKDFIADNADFSMEDKEKSALCNKLKLGELEVEVTTVHSVKGQTHSATLYLESSYYGKHETEKLSDQFLGQPFKNPGVRSVEAAKMVYVGLSRPTDLLCIAVQRDRYENFLSKIDRAEWEILEVD